MKAETRRQEIACLKGDIERKKKEIREAKTLIQQYQQGIKDLNK